MRSTVNDRVALVTGANRGMGLETCRQLLKAGLRVVATGRDLKTTEAAVRSLGVADARAIALGLDVTDVTSIRAAHSAATQRFGAVDVLVNNAAILLHEEDSVLSTPLDAYRETFETNLFGVIEVCRAFVPEMAERDYGRIVNVSSGAGQLAHMSTYAPAYSISKTALNAFTRQLAAEYRDRGVLVNAVDPGWVKTDMGGPNAPRSLERGVETTVWLATLPRNGPTGGFFHDRKAIAW